MAMSRNDDYVPLTNSVDHSMVDSDMDDTNASSSQGLSQPTDYWFGKKYFESVIAEGIFNSIGEDDSIETADSLFEEAIRKFPYQEAIDRLRSTVASSLGSRYLPRRSSDYTILMAFLGMTVRLGESKDRRALLAIIRSLHSADSGNVDDASSNSRSTRTSHKTEFTYGHGHSTTGETDMPNIDSYTSMLKEIGDQEGWQPKYLSGRYEKDPTLFQTTVSFSGYAFQGLPARNSRLAKHQASKAACDFLDDQRRHA